MSRSTATDVPAWPVSDRPTALPTSARSVTAAPDRDELETIRERVAAVGTALPPDHATRINVWAARGEYSAALAVLHEPLELAPHNLTLAHLYESLHAVFLALLERRVGGDERYVMAVRETHGLLGAPYVAIVELAAKVTTIRRIMHALGGDPVAALERVIRLLNAGFLEFGGLALDRGARPHSHATEEASQPKSGVQRAVER